MTTSFSTRLDGLVNIACKAPVLGVLVRAGIRGSKNHVKDMAASIAFFSFLSLFPLALGMIAVAGSILKSEQLRQQVIQWITDFFPVGADFVTQNIESLVRLRGAAGLASVLVLFWSAKKMVGAMSRGINIALGQKRSHAIYLSPLRNFGLVFAVSSLMYTTTAISPMADLVSGLELSFLSDYWRELIQLVGSQLVGVASTGAMIGLTYLLIPYQRPKWNELWPGLVTATVFIEIGKKIFVYYVDNISGMDAVYGSISSIIVLLLWLYFFGRVLLYGADVNYIFGQSHENRALQSPEDTE